MTAPATLAACGVEALCVAWREPTASLPERALRAAGCLGLWALPGAVAALAQAFLFASVCGEESFEEARRSSTKSSLPLAVGALALFTLSVFELTVASRAFRNAELAAMLVALASVVMVGVLGAVWVATTRWLRAGGPLLVVWAGSLFLAASASVHLLTQTWGGLAQLDGRLAAAPLTWGLATLLLDRVRARVGRAPLVGAAIIGAVAAVTFGALPPSAVVPLMAHGPWSRPLIAALRALSDFDRDGYSSLLGGGDCAPFDAEVGPRAEEVPGDGVDNNCVGGDGGRALEPRRPIWGESVHGAPTNQNVVIVTIETLRQDHASFVGAKNDTTPNLRRLASSSLVFERMYAAAPYTRLSLASLFSSLAPSQIAWQTLVPGSPPRHISEENPWFPALLAERGYETIAVLTSFSAFTAQENIGFERGFRHYDVTTSLEYRGGTMWGFPAATQVEKALGYVERAERPFFLWLHLFEPHYRYEQPPGAPVFGTDERARYDAEIWHVDAQLGRLFEGLRRLDAWDNTVLLVTGDHGESFGEHDDRWHGTNLFDPQVRPAALLRVPGVTGKRVDVSVTFTDLAPTLARVLGDRATFEQLRGRSLAPLLHHSTLPKGQEGFVLETFNIADGRAYQAAFVAFPLKLVYEETSHRFSLFDLSRDPGEQQPLDARTEPRAAPLLKELVGYLERARPRALRPP